MSSDITIIEPESDYTAARISRLDRASLELHQAIREAAQAARALYADADLGYMQVRVEVKGRPDGDLKVEFSAGEDYSSLVDSNAFASSVREFLRRAGWDAENAPLAISNKSIF